MSAVQEQTTPAAALRIAVYRPNEAAETAAMELARFSIAHLFGYDEVAKELLSITLGKGPLLEALASIPVGVLLEHISEPNAREELLRVVEDEIIGQTICAHEREQREYMLSQEEYDREHKRHRCVIAAA